MAASQRVFLTAHLLYFTSPPPPTPTKVLMSNSNLQQFYNGGGRGGKAGHRVGRTTSPDLSPLPPPVSVLCVMVTTEGIQ